MSGKHLQCDTISPVEAYPSTFNNLALQFLRKDAFPRDDDLIWQLPASNHELQESDEIV